MIRENELDYEAPERTMRSIERFLASELYGCITEIPGDQLLRMVRIRELTRYVRILREVLADSEHAEIYVSVRRERKDGATIRGRLPDRAEFLGLAALEIRLGMMEAQLLTEQTGRHYANERPQTLTEPPCMRRRDRRQMERDVELLRWATTRPSSAHVTVVTRTRPTRRCPEGAKKRYAPPPKLANDIINILGDELQDIKMELKTEGRR